MSVYEYDPTTGEMIAETETFGTEGYEIAEPVMSADEMSRAVAKVARSVEFTPSPVLI